MQGPGTMRDSPQPGKAKARIGQWRMDHLSPPERTALTPPWRHGFALLGDQYFTAHDPEALPDAHWVARCDALARELNLDARWWNGPAALQTFGGNQLPAGAGSVATVYAGHQFGVWAGQLGDGRALLLGELTDQSGQTQELALKGTGRTRYSRSGDGRAVLRSSIREFLASEAMHGLGIPTTRALCVVGSSLPVWRELEETAAVTARVAPSFVRFGHFEHFSHLHRPVPGEAAHAALRQLADWVIARHFPECAELSGAQRYAGFLRHVSARTAQLLAQWQAVGFCHGVMNSDNMSILGLTLDYGPFQFMDRYDPAHVCNHSDTQGRYAFAQQPVVAQWNLFCLAQALMPLIGEPDLALEALEPYQPDFEMAWHERMRAKLGLSGPADGDRDLIGQTLTLLHKHRLDYSQFWRRLSRWVADGASPEAAAALDQSGAGAPPDLLSWLERYRQRLGGQDWAETGRSMLRENPKFVLRKHLAQQSIAAAQQGDFSAVQTLLTLLESPFDEHPGFEHFADAAPDWADHLPLSCSS